MVGFFNVLADATKVILGVVFCLDLLLCLLFLMIRGFILVLGTVEDFFQQPKQTPKTTQPSTSHGVHIHHFYDSNGIERSEAPPKVSPAEWWTKYYEETAAEEKKAVTAATREQKTEFAKAGAASLAGGRLDRCVGGGLLSLNN
jgi:hypothetical protein